MLRAGVEEAMLVASGELGYPEVSVQDVLDRSGCSRVRFYQLFNGKGDCYARAYEAEIEKLGGGLLEVAERTGGWRPGLRAALVELAGFVAQCPLLAKGLLVEVHAVGEPALAKRTEMIERLSHAIDGARRENESRHSPPPVTAEFMVCAIEEAVVTALAREEPERFAAAIPELAYIVVSPFFGSEAALEDMRALQMIRPT